MGIQRDFYHWRSNPDIDLRTLERRYQETGDPADLAQIIIQRRRTGLPTAPSRNIFLAAGLHHPVALLLLESISPVDRASLPTDPNDELYAPPITRFYITAESLFYVADLLWELYLEELSKYLGVYFDLYDHLDPIDKDFLEGTVPPPLDVRDYIMPQAKAISQDPTLLNYYNPNFDTDQFTPQQADFLSQVISYEQLIDLNELEASISNNYQRALSCLANAYSCLYYYTDDPDTVTEYLHREPWSDVLSASTASILTQSINIVILALDYFGECAAVMELDPELSSSASVEDLKPLKQQYFHDLCMRLGHKLLLDTRPIPPEMAHLIPDNENF